MPAYIFASYVAISRLPANRHWLSDAVFGSSVGIIAGRTVTRHGREFPVTVAAVPGGAAIVFARSTRRQARRRPFRSAIVRRDVPDDANRFEGDEPLGDEFVDRGKKRVHLLLRINNLDQDRQIG